MSRISETTAGPSYSDAEVLAARGVTMSGVSQLEARLAKLAALPEDWDGYGAPRISSTALNGVRQILLGATIVPLGNGGAQIEWRLDGYEIEIAVDPDGSVEVTCEEDDRQELIT